MTSSDPKGNSLLGSYHAPVTVVQMLTSADPLVTAAPQARQKLLPWHSLSGGNSDPHALVVFSFPSSACSWVHGGWEQVLDLVWTPRPPEVTLQSPQGCQSSQIFPGHEKSLSTPIPVRGENPLYRSEKKLLSPFPPFPLQGDKGERTAEGRCAENLLNKGAGKFFPPRI